jgi:hypothetical protein
MVRYARFPRSYEISGTKDIYMSITTHPKELASTVLEDEEPRRLKQFKPTYLTTRFS